jgi:ABC-type multidrug transport system fused ATPase/permease subunit
VGVIAPIGLVVYSIMLLGYLIMLSILSWEMTLLSAITLLFSSRIPNIWIKKSAINSRKIVNSNKLISEFLVGRLRSPRLVRLAGNEDLEKNEFKNLTQTQRKFLLYAAILKAKSDVVMEPIVIGLSLIFLYFSYTFLHLQIEIIGLYLVIALRLLPIVKGIISEWHVVQRSRGSIEVLDNRLKAMQNSIEKDFGEKSFGKFKQSIVFNNVSYSYSSNKDTVLKNIKVEFEANKMSAIVGPSGSGKSTLIDLLPRLRTPVEGLIQIDDVDIKEYSLKSLRDAISYVPQFPQIFNGTVRNHILYGKMNATNEEVQKAACLAGAEDFINKLPQGFDTVLSDDAINISGGQRQRLDLARALLKGAPILILDEPTSNLDAESESVFKKTLAKIQKDTNTTIIIIVHKLSSIVDADKIIVLNQGAIDSIGAHSELLYHDGWYKKAWKMQELLE